MAELVQKKDVIALPANSRPKLIRESERLTQVAASAASCAPHGESASTTVSGKGPLRWLGVTSETAMCAPRRAARDGVNLAAASLHSASCPVAPIGKVLGSGRVVPTLLTLASPVTVPRPQGDGNGSGRLEESMRSVIRSRVSALVAAWGNGPTGERLAERTERRLSRRRRRKARPAAQQCASPPAHPAINGPEVQVQVQVNAPVSP